MNYMERAAAVRRKIIDTAQRAGTAGLSRTELATLVGITVNGLSWHLPRMPEVVMSAATIARRQRIFHVDFKAAAERHAVAENSYMAINDGVSGKLLRQVKAIIEEAGAQGISVPALNAAVRVKRNHVYRALAELCRHHGVVQVRDQLRPDRRQNRAFAAQHAPQPGPRLLASALRSAAKVQTPSAPQGNAVVTDQTKITRGIDFVDRRHRVDPADVHPVFSTLKLGQYLPGDSWAAKVYPAQGAQR